MACGSSQRIRQNKCRRRIKRPLNSCRIVSGVRYARPSSSFASRSAYGWRFTIRLRLSPRSQFLLRGALPAIGGRTSRLLRCPPLFQSSTSPRGRVGSSSKNSIWCCSVLRRVPTRQLRSDVKNNRDGALRDCFTSSRCCFWDRSWRHWLSASTPRAIHLSVGSRATLIRLTACALARHFASPT